MTGPAAKPDSDGVFEEINAFLSRTTHYRSATEFELRLLEKRAKALVNADAAAGHCALACIYQTTGDKDLTLRHIDIAIQNAALKAAFYRSRVGVLCNLGYFSEAQRVFPQAAHPETGQMSNSWKRGYLCGAFRLMKTYLQQARKMAFDLGELDTDTAERAANVLEKAGVTDAKVAETLDVVGKVLRSHKLFFVGLEPSVKVFDKPEHEPFVQYVFDVDTSANMAHHLYREYVDCVAEQNALLPRVLNISFRPWKRQDERNAA